MVVSNAVKDDFTLVGLHGAGNRFDESGFPRSVFTHQGVNFSFAETDGHVIERDHAGIAFGNVMQFKQFHAITSQIIVLDILAFSLRLVYKRSGSIVVTRVTFAERNFFALFVQVPQRF